MRRDAPPNCNLPDLEEPGTARRVPALSGLRNRGVRTALLDLMKTARCIIDCLLLPLLAASAQCALAQDTTPAPSLTIKESEPRTGTSIRRTVVTYNLPLNKTYHQLTHEQQEVVRDNYVALHPLDEPPFPAAGLGPLFTTLQKGATAFRAEGELVVFVAVGSDGRPTAATIVKTPNQKFGEFAGSATLLTIFKPALCIGQPCAMEFPVRLSLTRMLR